MGSSGNLENINCGIPCVAMVLCPGVMGSYHGFKGIGHRDEDQCNAQLCRMPQNLLYCCCGNPCYALCGVKLCVVMKEC